MFDLFQILGIGLIYLGIICSLIASIGLFYFPDVFTRIHATGVTCTLGAGLFLVGLMLYGGWNYGLGKLLLILLFTLLTGPTISYVLANTALKRIPLAQNNHSVTTMSDKGVETSNR